MKTKFDFEVKNGEKRISAVYLTAEECIDFDFLLILSAALKTNPDGLFECVGEAISKTK